MRAELVVTVLLLWSLETRGAMFEILGREKDVHVNFIPHREVEAQMVFNGRQETLYLKNGEAVLANAVNSVEWRTEAHISYMRVIGNVVHRSEVTGSQLAEWKLFALDNFSSGERNDWGGADSLIRTCGPARDKSMFRDCKSKIAYFEKTFHEIDAHSELKIFVNVHFLDQWEGEQAYIQINDETVWTRTYQWCNTIFHYKCVTDGVNVCGEAYPDLIGQYVMFVYPHTAKTVKIRIGSSLKSGNCDANWGFNNFMLYLR